MLLSSRHQERIALRAEHYPLLSDQQSIIRTILESSVSLNCFFALVFLLLLIAFSVLLNRTVLSYIFYGNLPETKKKSLQGVLKIVIILRHIKFARINRWKPSSEALKYSRTARYHSFSKKKERRQSFHSCYCCMCNFCKTVQCVRRAAPCVHSWSNIHSGH